MKHISVDRLFVIAGLFMLAASGLVLATPVANAQEQNEETSAQEAQEVNDPFESVNRVTSGFNRIFRKVVADPLVSGYKAVTPDPLEKAISNFASNLTEPVTAASSLLQGDTEGATRATSRFIVNTTVGMGGTKDAAADLGVEQRQEDLGQAAGKAGVSGGAHIVLPIVGPSNMRDVTGDVLTTLANPLHTAVSAANAGAGYAENRDEIKSMTNKAVDPYIVERDAYEQKI
ncbi:MAG: VacJ family lipoprotein, partial [Rhodospirillaceae bacterium]|nr:VacJ family lipoprotein [Rhodospirillaceae bacterium]